MPSRDVTHISVADKYFTDREDAIHTFQECIAADAQQPLPVLCFYGVGGAGKTLLLHKLCEVLRNQYSGVPFARVSFDRVDTRDPIAALTSLRVQLGQGFGLDFPQFDLLRAVIATRAEGGREDLFSVNRWLQAAFDIVTAIFAPGGAARAGGAHGLDAVLRRYPGSEKRLRQWGGTEGILKLRHLDDQQLLSALIRAFAQDLADGAPARDGQACRAVIFLDTYEKLWEGIPGGAASPQAAEQDAWVRELRACLSDANSVLLVIAGRDCLRWNQGGSVEAHLIGGLSLPDTQLYLSKCEVGRPPADGAPEPLQRAIFDCASEGDVEEGALPFYVGLCANIVLQERDKTGADPAPDTFAGIPGADVARALAGRFLRSLPDTHIAELVRTLSVPRWFDRALVNERVGGSADSQRAVWRTLEGFSFLEFEPDGTVTMHAVMREALLYLLESEQPADFIEVHEWMRSHWSDREDDPRAEREAWYHWLHVEPAKAIIAWCGLAQQAYAATQSARGRDLIGWLDGIDLTEDRWREALGDEAWGQALYNVAYDLDDLRTFALQPGPICLACIDLLAATLGVYTEEQFRQQWATIQNNLGKAWWDLPTGDRADNLRRAIKCYEAALRVRTQANFPHDWAMTQTNLGNALSDLPTGDRASSLRRAIACYEAALHVCTERACPQHWALIQINLGKAWRHLPGHDHTDKLRHAIRCYRAALRVFTKKGFPQRWALTKDNLGLVWSDLLSGNRSDNICRAIACHQAALRVRTEEDCPQQWATSQNNLGVAWASRRTGDRAANLHRAIECYCAALRVRTEEGAPEYWASTQGNLASARLDLAELEDRVSNLATAEGHVRNALRVFTEQAFPGQHSDALGLLQWIEWEIQKATGNDT